MMFLAIMTAPNAHCPSVLHLCSSALTLAADIKMIQCGAHLQAEVDGQQQELIVHDAPSSQQGPGFHLPGSSTAAPFGSCCEGSVVLRGLMPKQAVFNL